MTAYIIVTPKYNTSSMGIVTLHKLCHTINRNGGRAYLMLMETVTKIICQDGDWTNPEWDTPCLKENEIGLINEAFVVYPEVVSGNPLNAPKVIRWMGNKEGFCCDGRKMMQGAGDFILAHSKSIRPNADYVLYSALINPCFFTDMPTPAMRRDLDVTYIGKGSLYGPVKVQPDTILVMRNWPINQEQLAMFLRNTRYFYTWDSWSACNVDAVLCGAVPYFLRYEPWTEEEIDGGEIGPLPRLDASRKFNQERFMDERSAMIAKINGLIKSWDERTLGFMRSAEAHFSR